MRAIGTTAAAGARQHPLWERSSPRILGAVMGIGLGLVLGWIVVKALQDQGLTISPCPVVARSSSSLVLALVLAVLAARIIPARAPPSSDILDADRHDRDAPALFAWRSET